MIKKQAFTIIEIMIAIAIIGTILAVIVTHSKKVVNYATNSKLATYAYRTLKSFSGNYIAKKGEIDSADNFCSYISTLAKVNGPANCSSTVGEYDNPSFANMNFFLENGMRFYNFGAPAKNSNKLSSLTSKKNELSELSEEDPDYAEKKATLEAEIEALNDEIENTSFYYFIYVDIDGKYRKGTLNEDIILFYVNVNGEVLPTGIAATDPKYISAGYKYLDTTGGTSTWKWIERSTSFKDAVCKSGFPLQTKGYCEEIPVDDLCETHTCQWIVNY